MSVTWPQTVSTLSMPVGGSENWEDGAGGGDASRPEEEVGMSMMTTTRASRRQNFAELRRVGEAGAVYQPWHSTFSNDEKFVFCKNQNRNPIYQHLNVCPCACMPYV